MAQFCLVHRNRDKFFWGRSSVTVFYDSGVSELSDLYRSSTARKA